MQIVKYVGGYADDNKIYPHICITTFGYFS